MLATKHIDFARRERELSPLPHHLDSINCLAEAEGLLAKEGLVPNPGYNPEWARMIFDRAVVCSRADDDDFTGITWAELPVCRRAEICWHVLVHARQRRLMGRLRWWWRWRTPEWVWAMEVQALRETVRVVAALQSPARAAARARCLARTIYQSHRLGGLDPDQVMSETEQILLEAARGVL